MRNANGYGSVYKLSGNRRRPWAVVLTSHIDENGKQIRKYLGFFPTQKEARKALADYNDHPYDINGYTFAEVFERFKDYKFPNISKSNQSGYNASFAKCAAIHGVAMQRLTFADLQKQIDPLTPPSQKKLATLYSQMYAFAIKRGIVSYDVSTQIEVRPQEKSVKHNRFSKAEIDVLWEHTDDKYIQVILMMIYSGVRPGEPLALRSSQVSIDGHSFSIKEGKNENAVRRVPIHDRTLPFFQNWLKLGGEYLITDSEGLPFNFQNDHGKYTRKYFEKPLADLGILTYTDGGETKKHYPDDVRHTFTTMWTEKKLSEIFRRKIQGHSGKGIGEQTYTHIEFEELLTELNKL